MNITITGRHFEITPSIREYADKKIQRLVKYFHQLIDVHVIMRVEKLDHIVEFLVNGDGIQFFGMEKTGDIYSSIDLLVDKMEKQISRYKSRQSDHKFVPHQMPETFELQEAEPLEFQMYQVSNKPKNDIEAYLEMKLDKSDFILFKKGMVDVKSDIDYANKNYAVMYRAGDALKMVEIPFEMIQNMRFNPKEFHEYEVKVMDDSPAKPKIKFHKKASCSGIDKITVREAMQKLMSDGQEFMPFFNIETKYFNIVYRNGKNYGVMVPAF
jgi:putative sigma-54 modulation protein